MRKLEWGNVRILDRTFRLYGYSDDTWYQDVKSKGYWAEQNLDLLRYLIAPDAICLDLGANVGTVATALSVLAERGQVYAFEGSLETTEALAKTVEVNRLANVRVFNRVIGKADEEVKFFNIPEVRSSGFSVPADSEREVATVRPETAEMIVLQSRSVDSLVRELSLPKVDFIKVDIEGAELDMLEGARDTLARFKPILIMEFNSYAFAHIREIPPRRALKRIFEVFDDIYYFVNRTGGLARLAKTQVEQERFLHNNLFGGFVDDLLCSYRDAKTADGHSLSEAIRMGWINGTPSADNKGLRDVRGTELLRELGFRVGRRFRLWQ
jgi:FkbM family methyltransferase